MKKLMAVLSVLMIAYVLFTAASDASAPAARVEPASASQTYVVRQEGERIAVYRGDSLVLRTDAVVSQLPKRDRTRLKN